MKIYTKTGDKGQTSLLGGERVSKSHERLSIYGRFDEINSQLGYLDSLISDDYSEIINELQKVLFVLGALAASDKSKWNSLKLEHEDPGVVEKIEQAIDKFHETLPELNNFILPSGCQSACWAHVVRSNIRSLERDICGVGFDIIPEWGSILINRLSDYFFVLARDLNSKASKSELAWP